MQYATPQFIESEGKIISFLTFRQFFWLVGGGVFIISFYYILPFVLFVIASFIIAVVVGIIAFVKIDNTPALTLLLNIMGFSVAIKNYTWKKKNAPYPFKLQKKVELKTIEVPPHATADKTGTSKLNDIRKLIDTRR